jgi:hypothetical protein
MNICSFNLSSTILKKEVHMPYRDGTGPNGKGSRTGRGLGKCKKTAKPAGQEFKDNHFGAEGHRRHRRQNPEIT